MFRRAQHGSGFDLKHPSSPNPARGFLLQERAWLCLFVKCVCFKRVVFPSLLVVCNFISLDVYLCIRLFLLASGSGQMRESGMN